MRFLPSLAMSILLNVALFGALHPIEGGRRTDSATRYRVQRLRRVAVRAATLPLPAPATPQAEAAPPRSPSPRKAAHRTPPATRTVATKARSRRTPGGGGDGRALSRRADSGLTGPVAQALGPTGGDGTRRTPTQPRAGGGDPLTATPREPGSPTAARTSVALGGSDTRAPLGQPDPVRDAPPRLVPVPGLHGGSPTAPTLGVDPLPGTAGSGDNPAGVAPATRAGFGAPPLPTTPGEQIRSKPGPGLPGYIPGTVTIPATTIARGNSGGGGGTGATPGRGGGGPPALAGLDRSGDGGGGSGLTTPALRPGGATLGPGPGGTGGGGNGLGTIGDGITGTPDGLSPRPAATGGAPSIITNPGHGVPDATPVRPGARAAGPGGGPSMAKAPAARPGRSDREGDGGHGGPGQPGGRGPGEGQGTGGGEGGGSHGTAVSRGDDGSSGFTALVIDSMALTWHHYPTSYDLHIGSVNGPRLATIGIYRYPSVASAKASERGTRHGRRNALVIRPQAIEYIVRDGEGARQRVVISADDAAKIRASGLLDERGRILTVWNDNVQ